MTPTRSGQAARKRKRGETPYTPHPMHECQNKRDRKWAICKRMKRKRLFFARKKGAIHKWMKRKNGDFDRRKLVNHNTHPPLFFVSVAAKGLRNRASLLFATLARRSISVAAKELMEACCWRESNGLGWGDFGGVIRTAGRASMAGGAREKRCRPNETIIAYPYRMSMITCKWFGCCGIARCVLSWHRGNGRTHLCFGRGHAPESCWRLATGTSRMAGRQEQN